MDRKQILTIVLSAQTVHYTGGGFFIISEKGRQYVSELS